MRANPAASTVRSLLASIPDQRLRELLVEIASAVVRCFTTGVSEQSAAPASADRVRRNWSRARRNAHNAKRREQRKLGKRLHDRKKAPPGNGPDNGAGVSAAALWKHAAKLEPKAPWRAVARELGVSDAAAQTAHRNGTLPANVSPVAAGRFLAL